MSAWPPVRTLLPHGPEACAIDAIVDFVPGRHLLADLRVHPGLTLFDAERNGVPAWAGIEIMAQAAGLYLGLAGRAQGLGRPALGYLLGVRRFRARGELLAPGADLAVEALCQSAEADGIGRFDCRILEGGQERARALLTLWRPPGECAK